MPELLRRCPASKYMIVGDGDDRSRLRHPLGLSKQIHFYRKNPEQEKAPPRIQ
jgi:hypothetical protein